MNTAIVIDDESSMRLLVTRVLKESGFDVLASAADADAGLREIIEHTPDVALVDLHLPVINGVQLTRQIAEHSPRTMIIILTAVADGRVAEECLNAGAFHYFEKDDRIAALGERVKEQWEEYQRKSL